MIQTILNVFYFIVTVLFLLGTWELTKLLREVRDILEEIRDKDSNERPFHWRDDT